MTKKPPESTHPRRIYAPAFTDVFPESTRRFPIVALDQPDQICGLAHRVGWVSQGSKKRALYRLKLSMQVARYGTGTLPSLYVLEDDVFVEYEGQADI